MRYGKMSSKGERAALGGQGARRDWGWNLFASSPVPCTREIRVLRETRGGLDRGPCPEGVGTALFSLTVNPNDVAHGTHGPAQCPVCRIGSTLLVETAVNRGLSRTPLRLVSDWSVPPRHAFRPGFARPSDSRPSWESLCLSQSQPPPLLAGCKWCRLSSRGV